MIEYFYLLLQHISGGSKYAYFPVPLVGMVAKAVWGSAVCFPLFPLSFGGVVKLLWHLSSLSVYCCFSLMLCFFHEFFS